MFRSVVNVSPTVQTRGIYTMPQPVFPTLIKISLGSGTLQLCWTFLNQERLAYFCGSSVDCLFSGGIDENVKRQTSAIRCPGTRTHG